MFKVTIIKLKDIVKIGIILILIYVFSNFMVKKISINKSFKFNYFDISKFSIHIINQESNIIKSISNNNNIQTQKKEKNDSSKFESILKIGSNIFNIKEKEHKENDKEIENTQNTVANNNDTSNIVQNDTIESQATRVVTENPIPESYNREFNGVKIKNETDFELTDAVLNFDNLEINKNNILIFHTHTCESYTQSDSYKYEPTGNYRTTDLNFSVARVGDELSNYLENYGFTVKHNKTYHDYPAYTGSYSRSFSTVQNILKEYNSDIIIDLHRDAIGSKENYAPLVKIGEDYCAQIMFVMGTNGGGLNHSNWQSNLKFAVKIQQKANEIYPGLFKPIVLRNSRYNQNLGKAACIIEVGATGNTLDQTLCSMKYLAKILSETLR